MRARQYIIPSIYTQNVCPWVMLSYADYPLPPHEDNVEILRIVVRENLSMDMIDHLVVDICTVTETLMKSDVIDLQGFQSWTSVEKRHSSAGQLATTKQEANRPMQKGVHRSVC